MIQVPGLDLLQVARELLLGVLVGLGVPGEPARRTQFEQLAQLLVAERLVADEVNAADLGDLAFVHIEHDRDAVAFDRGHGGGDLDAVQAVRQVLALEFLFGAVDRRLVEDLGLGHADFGQRLDQHVFFEFLGAGEVDRRNRRTLFDQHDQHAVFFFEADVLEEAGRVQGLDRAGCLDVVEGFAHAHRQIAEHGACLGTLDAFDPDVLDDERIDGHGLIGVQRGAQGQDGGSDQAAANERQGKTIWL